MGNWIGYGKQSVFIKEEATAEKEGACAWVE